MEGASDVSDAEREHLAHQGGRGGRGMVRERAGNNLQPVAHNALTPHGQEWTPLEPEATTTDEATAAADVLLTHHTIHV